LIQFTQHFNKLFYYTCGLIHVQAFSELLSSGRLSPANVDVKSYEVDKEKRLARKDITPHRPM